MEAEAVRCCPICGAKMETINYIMDGESEYYCPVCGERIKK